VRGQLNSGVETVAGNEVTLDICTACARCRVEALLQKIDRRSGKVLEESPTSLKAGEVGFCRLGPLQPVRPPLCGARQLCFCTCCLH